MFRRDRNHGLLIITIFLSVLLINIASAGAAAIDAAGAVHLKTVFTAALNAQDQKLRPHGARITQEGPLTVVPHGDYYAVTLPRLAVVSTDGSRMAIGVITVNAQPDTMPGQWKMTVTLPMPLGWFAPDGARKLSVTVGRQTLEGLWSEKLNGFVKLDAEGKDIKVTAADKSYQGIIGDLHVFSHFSETGAGLWSGPVKVVVDGLSIAANDGSTVSIGHDEADLQIDNYSPDAAADAFSAASLKNSLNDFVETHASGKIMLARADFGADLKDLQQEGLRLRLALNYKNLNLSPPSKTVPDRLAADITLDKISYATLDALGGALGILVTDARSHPDTAGMAWMHVINVEIPEILARTGTRVMISALNFGNDLYSTVIKGALVFDSKAAHGLTGKIRTEIAGMNRLIDVLYAQTSDPHASPHQKEMAQKMVPMLSVAQALGQQDNGARVYNVEMTREGQILLNGADINTLFPTGGAASTFP